ncbi:MAG TPA: Cthe_2314 family HEPN domain-containing protein [Pedobacter sp.]|nr:Cthe_2314 family HEPN domain-containing protein [Pedobacter sp.]
MGIQSYLDHTEELLDVYKALNLQSIDDFHADVEERWNNNNFLSYFVDVTRSVAVLNPFIESDFKMYDDFVLLSGDIKFCAGMLHYLHPYISSSPYNITATRIDRRYIMHVSFGYQSIYQFWDRIGDLLWHFFPTGLAKDAVYTGRVLNNIPNIFKLTEPYKSLKELFDEFKEFFEIRNDLVHSFTLGTEIYWQRNAAYGDIVLQQQLIDKLLSYRDIITESLPSCISALRHSLLLISEIKSQPLH